MSDVCTGAYKKLPLADFSTLNGTHWLSDAVIDFILNMINTKGVYRIIDAELHAQFIFNEPEHSFLKNFKIVKEHLYIPLLVHGNHWCAIEISISKKEFTYLDPFGEQLSTCSSYLKKFIMYLKKSKQLESLQNYNSWKIVSRKHLKQNDANNCGIYIIYFFKQIIQNESLNECANMNELRKEFQTDILKSSVSVENICLICGSTRNEISRKCKLCLRIFHERCLFENEMKKDVCELCIHYSCIE